MKPRTVRYVVTAAGVCALIVGYTITRTRTNPAGHVPKINTRCGGLIVDLTRYRNEHNKVTVTIDGHPVVAEFGTSYHHTYPWDTNTAHDYRVDIDGETEGDRSIAGHVEACPTTTTSTIGGTTSTPTTNATTSTYSTTPPTSPATSVATSVPTSLPPTTSTYTTTPPVMSTSPRVSTSSTTTTGARGLPATM